MKAALCIIIHNDAGLETVYRLKKLREGWRLTKVDGSDTAYDVEMVNGVPHCGCEDFRCRRRICKHQKALVEVELLPGAKNARQEKAV